MYKILHILFTSLLYIFNILQLSLEVLEFYWQNCCSFWILNVNVSMFVCIFVLKQDNYSDVSKVSASQAALVNIISK